MPTGYLLGFVASVVEVALIAAALRGLRVPHWIYLVTPIAPAVGLFKQLCVGGEFFEFFRMFGIWWSWSFYLTAVAALISFSILYATRRFHSHPA
jgi:hypothetical protein